MRYQKDPYEDEIDRMRARKKHGERRNTSRNMNVSCVDCELIEFLVVLDWRALP